MRTPQGGTEVRLLGAPAILTGGQVLDVGGPKPRLLLALLLAGRGRAVATDALAEEIWGPAPDVEVASGLQNLVSRVRRALTRAGLTVVGHGQAYALETAGVRVDADEFADLAERGARHLAGGAPAAAVESLTAALALWRGPALAGYTDSALVRAEAARLDEARLGAVESLADALLAAGRPADAVTALEPHVEAAPYREEAWARLMLALYRAGRQADALAAYRRVRAVLADELGLEPGPALRRLEGRILAQSADLYPQSPGPTDLRAFLFTDIEASTRRWEGDREAMTVDLARHDGLLRSAVEAHAGRVMSHTGDGLCADFPNASAAARAAVDGQRALAATTWRGPTRLRVRMAVHVGAAQSRDGSWFGPALNRTARLLAVAAGGQVLCSAAAADLALDDLPAGAGLIDLGPHRLSDLARPERVFQLTHPQLEADFPALAAPVADPQNLPTTLGRFLGRDAELAELEKFLASERLLTLWGPGGAGKTRLSLELGARVLPGFPDGVWFVELAPLDRAELVGPAVMSALGMLSGGAGDPTRQLCRYLGGREALLILDNCEHLLSPVADLAHALLASCPGVRIVTSSRELLGVPGELAWPTPPLSLPPEDAAGPEAAAVSDAVALFCERARSAHPAFALTAANADAVVEICRRLDGMPLALELAAARVHVLGVKGLAERLDDRFRVLIGGARTGDARHRTLRSAVDWSHGLLPAAEQDLLAHLSVFPGTFDLAAAEAVAPDDPGADVGFGVLDLLARLVAKSLVVAVDDASGQVRYRLLETIRQYAAEQLQARFAVDAVRRRHRDHFLDSPVTAWQCRWTWDYGWLLEAHRDHDNFRAALEFSIADGAAGPAARIAAGLWAYWLWTEHPAGRAWAERVLAMPGLPRDAPTAELLMGLAWYARSYDRARAAIAIGEESGDPRLLARLYFMAADGDISPDAATSRALMDAAMQASAAPGLSACLAWCHFTQAWLALAADDRTAAVAHAERSLALSPPHGPGPVLGAHFHGTLAFSLAASGADPDRAQEHADRAIEAARGLPLPGFRAMVTARAAAAAVFAGRWPRASALLADQLHLLRRLGTRRWAAEALEFAGLTLEATGDPGTAARLLADAHRVRVADGETAGGTLPALAAELASCRGRLRAPGPADRTPADLDAVLLAAADDLARAAQRPPLNRK